MCEITQFLTQRIDAARASGDVPFAMALLADLDRYERRQAIAACEAAEAEGIRQFGLQIEIAVRADRQAGPVDSVQCSA